MKALDFLLPAKSPAFSTGNETPEFHPSSAKSSEPFDALMNRALAEPPPERGEIFYAAKKTTGASRSSRAAKNDASIPRKSRPADRVEAQASNASQSPDHDERSIRDAASGKRREDSSSEDSNLTNANNSDQSIAAGADSVGVDAATALQALASSEAAKINLQTASATGTSKNAGVGEGNNSGAANAITQASIPKTADVAPESAKGASEKPPKPGANEAAGGMKEIPGSSGESAKNSGSANGAVPVQALLDKAEIGNEPALNATNSAAGKAHSPLSETAGISAAQQDATMKKTDNAPKIAGQSEQNLPGVTVVAAEQSSARAKPAAKSDSRTEPLETTAYSSAVDRAPATSETASSNLVSASSQSDLRVRTLDRTHDMVALHGMRLKESNTDSLHVVIKPGAGLQLSLQLKQNGDGIEAQAILQRGDFNQLNQHWTELQKRLEQHGIRLAPLGSENSPASDNNENFQRQPHQRTEQDFSFAGFSPKGQSPKSKVGTLDLGLKTFGSSRGWESWA